MNMRTEDMDKVKSSITMLENHINLLRCTVCEMAEITKLPTKPLKNRSAFKPNVIREAFIETRTVAVVFGKRLAKISEKSLERIQAHDQFTPKTRQTLQQHVANHQGSINLEVATLERVLNNCIAIKATSLESSCRTRPMFQGTDQELVNTFRGYLKAHIGTLQKGIDELEDKLETVVCSPEAFYKSPVWYKPPATIDQLENMEYSVLNHTLHSIAYIKKLLSRLEDRTTKRKTDLEKEVKTDTHTPENFVAALQNIQTIISNHVVKIDKFKDQTLARIGASDNGDTNRSGFWATGSPNTEFPQFCALVKKHLEAVHKDTELIAEHIRGLAALKLNGEEYKGTDMELLEDFSDYFEFGIGSANNKLDILSSKIKEYTTMAAKSHAARKSTRKTGPSPDEQIQSGDVANTDKARKHIPFSAAPPAPDRKRVSESTEAYRNPDAPSSSKRHRGTIMLLNSPTLFAPKEKD